MPASRSSASALPVAIGSSRQVARRHHERDADVGEQEVVQRRVRQHHAELGEAGAASRSARADRRGTSRRTPQQHDRPHRPGRAAPLPRPDRPRRGARAASMPGTMTASGLPQRCLRSRSRVDGVLVGRVARQLEPAQSLDREDPPVPQHRFGRSQYRRPCEPERPRASRCGRGTVSTSGVHTQSSGRDGGRFAGVFADITGPDRRRSKVETLSSMSPAVPAAGPRLRNSRGPQTGRHSAARGSAGSRGRRTPRRTPGTSGSPASVVTGRSYGTSSMIVKRGPQLVQLVNG